MSIFKNCLSVWLVVCCKFKNICIRIRQHIYFSQGTIYIQQLILRQFQRIIFIELQENEIFSELQENILIQGNYIYPRKDIYSRKLYSFKNFEFPGHSGLFVQQTLPVTLNKRTAQRGIG